MERPKHTSAVIHTNVECLLQQLATSLVAATRKRRGGTTSKRHKTTSHNGTPTPTSAPRLHFRWHVITVRHTHGTITNAYGIPNVIKCPEHCREMWKNDTNLIYNPWEIFQKGWQRHHEKMHAPPRTRFRTDPEQQQQQFLQDESRAPRKNQTLKHK